MSYGVRHPDKNREYYFIEGCHILESWNNPADPAASIARARVAPGMTTRWHALAGVTERYLIISGEGRAEVGEETAESVTEGDVVIIPPGVLMFERELLRRCQYRVALLSWRPEIQKRLRVTF